MVWSFMHLLVFGFGFLLLGITKHDQLLKMNRLPLSLWGEKYYF